MECTPIGIRRTGKGMCIAGAIFLAAAIITMANQGLSLFFLMLGALFVGVGYAAMQRPDLFPFIFE